MKEGSRPDMHLTNEEYEVVISCIQELACMSCDTADTIIGPPERHTAADTRGSIPCFRNWVKQGWCLHGDRISPVTAKIVNAPLTVSPRCRPVLFFSPRYS